MLETALEDFLYYAKNWKSAGLNDERIRRLVERTLDIRRYVTESGVSPVAIPYAEPMGYGYLATGQSPLWDNWLMERVDIALTIRDQLVEAIGHYRRRNETFNPIFWAEFALFLPRQLFAYIGIPQAKAGALFTNFVQVVYWIAGILVAMKNLGWL